MQLLKFIYTGYQILKPANQLVMLTHPVTFSDKWIHVVVSYKGKSLVNDWTPGSLQGMYMINVMARKIKHADPTPTSDI